MPKWWGLPTPNSPSFVVPVDAEGLSRTLTPSLSFLAFPEEALSCHNSWSIDWTCWTASTPSQRRWIHVPRGFQVTHAKGPSFLRGNHQPGVTNVGRKTRHSDQDGTEACQAWFPFHFPAGSALPPLTLRIYSPPSPLPTGATAVLPVSITSAPRVPMRARASQPPPPWRPTPQEAQQASANTMSEAARETCAPRWGAYAPAARYRRTGGWLHLHYHWRPHLHYAHACNRAKFINPPLRLSLRTRASGIACPSIAGVAAVTRSWNVAAADVIGGRTLHSLFACGVYLEMPDYLLPPRPAAAQMCGEKASEPVTIVGRRGIHHRVKRFCSLSPCAPRRPPAGYAILASGWGTRHT